SVPAGRGPDLHRPNGAPFAGLSLVQGPQGGGGGSEDDLPGPRPRDSLGQARRVEVRLVTNTTNAIESLHTTLRKIKTRDSFPNDGDQVAASGAAQRQGGVEAIDPRMDCRAGPVCDTIRLAALAR